MNDYKMDKKSLSEIFDFIVLFGVLHVVGGRQFKGREGKEGGETG